MIVELLAIISPVRRQIDAEALAFATNEELQDELQNQLVKLLVELAETDPDIRQIVDRLAERAGVEDGNRSTGTEPEPAEI